MKYKTLLKPFLLLALIFAFSSVAYASEVTGNLSSGGNTTNSGSSVNGTIGGMVAGNGNSSGGGGGGSRQVAFGGSVLGASTLVVANDISTDGMALSPPPRGIATTDDAPILAVGGSVLGATTPNISPDQITATTANFGYFSVNTWIWILLLLLFLVAFVLYIYNRPLDRNRVERV